MESAVSSPALGFNEGREAFAPGVLHGLGGRQVDLCAGLILSRVQGDAVPERHGTQGSQQGQARHLRFHVLMLIAFHDLTFGLLD